LYEGEHYDLVDIRSKVQSMLERNIYKDRKEDIMKDIAKSERYRKVPKALGKVVYIYNLSGNPKCRVEGGREKPGMMNGNKG
jgi:hypothetical protein